MSPKKRDAFVSVKVALPTCGGCDQCGDFRPLEDVLYIMGHDKKYYCKGCFQRIATRWPRRRSDVQGSV